MMRRDGSLPLVGAVALALGCGGESAGTSGAGGQSSTSSASSVASGGQDGAGAGGGAAAVGGAGGMSSGVGGDASGGGPTLHPNEPPGLSPLAERPFAADPEDGWLAATGGMTASDATAPVSPPSVFRFGKAAGAGAGSMGTLEKNITDVTELYVEWWSKHSANWQGHVTSTNKSGLFLRINGGAQIFSNAKGVGAGTLRAGINFQGLALNCGGNDATGNWDSVAALNGPVIVRDEWQHHEVYVRLNTGADVADGVLRAWMDGASYIDRSDVCYLGTGMGVPANAKLTHLVVNPIWGGTGDTAAETMELLWDHVYASGL